MSTSQNGSTRCFKFRCAIRTDVGLRRKENQDAYAVAETTQASLFLVADGMGGARGGGTASATAVDEITRRALLDQEGLSLPALRQAIEETNTAIFELAQADQALSGMGTTVVALGFVDRRAIVAHVGDSRIYRLRDGELTQLTRDHTLVQELVDTGAIPKDEAADHPIAHMLTRSLGPTEKVDVEIQELYEPVKAGDKYVLCCDGVYNLVSNEEIADVVESREPEDAADAVVALAIRRGGTDNITIEIIEVFDLDDDSVDVSYPSNPEQSYCLVSSLIDRPETEVPPAYAEDDTSETAGPVQQNESILRNDAPWVSMQGVLVGKPYIPDEDSNEKSEVSATEESQGVPIGRPYVPETGRGLERDAVESRPAEEEELSPQRSDLFAAEIISAAAEVADSAFARGEMPSGSVQLEGPQETELVEGERGSPWLQDSGRGSTEDEACVPREKGFEQPLDDQAPGPSDEGWDLSGAVAAASESVGPTARIGHEEGSLVDELQAPIDDEETEEEVELVTEIAAAGERSLERFQLFALFVVVCSLSIVVYALYEMQHSRRPLDWLAGLIAERRQAQSSSVAETGGEALPGGEETQVAFLPGDGGQEAAPIVEPSPGDNTDLPDESTGQEAPDEEPDVQAASVASVQSRDAREEDALFELIGRRAENDPVRRAILKANDMVIEPLPEAMREFETRTLDDEERLALEQELIDGQGKAAAESLPHFIAEQEKLRVVERKQELRDRISFVDVKFELTVFGTIKEAEARLVELEKEIRDNALALRAVEDEVRKQEEQSAFWLSRERVVHRSDMLELAEEMAGEDEFIQEKRRAYERVSSRYLETVERWQQNPRLNYLAASKMAALGRELKAQRRELQVALVEGIKRRTEETRRRLVDLHVIYDNLRRREKRLHRQFGFFMPFSPLSDSRRARVQQELMAARREHLREIEALEHMMSDEEEVNFRRKLFLERLLPAEEG